MISQFPLILKQNEIHPFLQTEMKVALLAVHRNTFFNLSDHLTPYIKNEFKGSNATKKISCGRTKTAAIINCIGDDIKSQRYEKYSILHYGRWK